MAGKFTPLDQGFNTLLLETACCLVLPFSSCPWDGLKPHLPGHLTTLLLLPSGSNNPKHQSGPVGRTLSHPFSKAPCPRYLRNSLSFSPCLPSPTHQQLTETSFLSLNGLIFLETWNRVTGLANSSSLKGTVPHYKQPLFCCFRP